MKKVMRVRWNLQDIKDWIISYLVILIIPIAICSVFFLYTYFVIWTETRDSNTAALQLIASEMDQVFEDSILFEYNIQNNANVKLAAEKKLPLTAQKRYLLVEASKDIQEYVSTDERFSSWYVYFPKNQMVLTVGSSYIKHDAFYERYGRVCGYTREEWKVLLEQKNDRTFLLNEETNHIAYIASLPMRSSTVSMNVIFEIDYEYMQRLLSHMDYMKNSGILIADNTNRVLMSHNLNDLKFDSLFEQLDNDKGYQRVFVDGQKMMASCIESERVGLKMVSVIPYREFWKKSLESLISFLVALLLCILTGTGVAYFFSVGKQKTWGKFKSIVNKKLERNIEKISFRSKEVETAIENIVAEYDNMQKQLTSVDSMKKELLLTAALRGRIRTEEVEHVFKKNNVVYELGYYVVMLFSLSRFDHFFDVEKQVSRIQEVSQIRQAVLSVIQPLFERNFDCEILNLDEKIVCVLNFGVFSQEDCYEQIEQFSELAKAVITDSANVFQTISVSDVHKSVASLHNAYSEASRVMEYQHSKEYESVMSYLEMVKKTRMSYLYSLENETALIHWIYAGKKDAALQLFEEIYEKNVINVNGSEDLRRCLMWNLTASVLRAENELRDKVNLPDMQNLLENIRSKITMKEAKEILMRRIASICDEVTKAKGKKGDMVAEQVMEYVQEHYMDPNLSNSEIAEYFHMNISYFSTFFKEKTGMSPLTYIHTIRLEKAKELLGESDMTLEEISAKVGCNNSVTLNRLFKKYEGITPAVYKKRNR